MTIVVRKLPSDMSLSSLREIFLPYSANITITILGEEWPGITYIDLDLESDSREATEQRAYDALLHAGVITSVSMAGPDSGCPHPECLIGEYKGEE